MNNLVDVSTQLLGIAKYRKTFIFISLIKIVRNYQSVAQKETLVLIFFPIHQFWVQLYLGKKKLFLPVKLSQNL